MKVAIFDLETFSLHADTGILLCAVIKEYGTDKPPVILRADQFPNWKNGRSNARPMAEAVIRALDGTLDKSGDCVEGSEGYDIFVAHNGTYFDRSMLISYALKYKLPVFLRFAKFIDPCQLSRRHLKLARNSLDKLIRWLDVEDEKTPILWEHWQKAAFDGNSKSLDYIVEHCVADVKALEGVYRKMKRLVKTVDEKGSSY